LLRERLLVDIFTRLYRTSLVTFILNFILCRRQQYIGKVNHAIFDSTGKKIIVGTEENVLALLHAGTGI
jgi:hypothetical protein